MEPHYKKNHILTPLSNTCESWFMLSKISTPANVISEVTQKNHLTERKRKENFKGGNIVAVFEV